MVFRLNTRAIWLTALLFFIGSPSLVAQVQSQIVADAKVNGQALRIANAISVETPPIVDGDVLNDPAWVQAVPVSGFLQSAPDEGQPATETNRGTHSIYEGHYFFWCRLLRSRSIINHRK